MALRQNRKLWAEAIENASQSHRASMGFRPFFVNPETGHLMTLLEGIYRNPIPQSGLPTPWPIGRAPGWFKVQLRGEWTDLCWCALGGEWVFQPPTSRKHVIVAPSRLSDEARARFEALRSNLPSLVANGEAISFCQMLFLLPDSDFLMNSFKYHPVGYEPLSVFIGFRGHPHPYPEVITPGLFRMVNRPSQERINIYRNKERIACNVARQIVFEEQNVVLTRLHAAGLLQHYDIIGLTDILDLSYDINVAKWFSLNERDSAKARYVPKTFVENNDRNRAYNEFSVVYKVFARALTTPLSPDVVSEIQQFDGTRLKPLNQADPETSPELTMKESLSRNLSPLWSERPTRQSGFGLHGVGPEDDDAWGSVLGIVEYRFHPTFAPNGWDPIGGPQMSLFGSQYRYNDDTSGLASKILPEDDAIVTLIREAVKNLLHAKGLG